MIHSGATRGGAAQHHMDITRHTSDTTPILTIIFRTEEEPGRLDEMES